VIDVIDNSEDGFTGVPRLGIFQESFDYNTSAGGRVRPALDFLRLEYHLHPEKGRKLRNLGLKFVMSEGKPILSLYAGIDHLLLEQKQMLTPHEIAALRAQLKIDTNQFNPPNQEAHHFIGRFNYQHAGFFNHKHEVYRAYQKQLGHAGFKV